MFKVKVLTSQNISLKKRIHKITRPLAVDEEFKECVELITKRKKPIIICGGGVRYSEAGEVLERFAEKFKIPIGETQAGKSAVRGSHHMNLGGIGVTGNLATNTIAKDADLVIGIGTRFQILRHHLNLYLKIQK